MLSRHLIDKRLRESAQTVCYFFFKDDDDDQKSITKALSALLHQLFSANKLLVKHALTNFSQNGDKLAGLFDRLWDILLSATSEEEAGHTICVIDALDKCPKAGRDIFLRALEDIIHENQSRMHSKLLFLVTSRPYEALVHSFANLAHIQLRGEEESEAISDEIDHVIDFRVNELTSKGCHPKLTPQLGEVLRARLLKHGNRTYLWLHLIFEELRKSFKKTHIGLRKVIDQLPNSVDAAYEKVLLQTPSRSQTSAILHIIIAATRPLTLKEMQIASVVNLECRNMEDLDLEKEKDFKLRLRKECGLFVTVQDQRVYLIHQTAKEFLVSKDIRQEPTTPAGAHHSVRDYGLEELS